MTNKPLSDWFLERLIRRITELRQGTGGLIRPRSGVENMHTEMSDYLGVQFRNGNLHLLNRQMQTICIIPADSLVATNLDVEFRHDRREYGVAVLLRTTVTEEQLDRFNLGSPPINRPVENPVAEPEEATEFPTRKVRL